MDTNPEFSAEVLAAIHGNRKIEAIKLLRQQRGVGLKEARDLVDTYVAEHPQLIIRRPPGNDYGMGRAVLIIVVSALFYGAYQLFTGT